MGGRPGFCPRDRERPPVRCVTGVTGSIPYLSPHTALLQYYILFFLLLFFITEDRIQKRGPECNVVAVTSHMRICFRAQKYTPRQAGVKCQGRSPHRQKKKQNPVCRWCYGLRMLMMTLKKQRCIYQYSNNNNSSSIIIINKGDGRRGDMWSRRAAAPWALQAATLVVSVMVCVVLCCKRGREGGASGRKGSHVTAPSPPHELPVLLPAF